MAHRSRSLEVLVFTVGAGSLGAEIAAARLLAPWFGASTIVWANTIAVVLVALAAGIAISSGMIFLPDDARGFGACLRTLPVQVFCWGVATMVLLYVAAQYCEAHCILVKNTCRV